MESAIALCGQVAGRIDAVRPVAEIMAEIREEFRDVVRGGVPAEAVTPQPHVADPNAVDPVVDPNAADTNAADPGGGESSGQGDGSY